MKYRSFLSALNRSYYDLVERGEKFSVLIKALTLGIRLMTSFLVPILTVTDLTIYGRGMLVIPKKSIFYVSLSST